VKKANRPPRPQTPVLSPKPTAADLMAFQLELRKYDRMLDRWARNLDQWEQSLIEREMELMGELPDGLDDDDCLGDIQLKDILSPKEMRETNVTYYDPDGPGFGIPAEDAFPCGCLPSYAEGGCDCDECADYMKKKNARISNIMEKIAAGSGDEVAYLESLFKLPDQRTP